MFEYLLFSMPLMRTVNQNARWNSEMKQQLLFILFLVLIQLGQ